MALSRRTVLAGSAAALALAAAPLRLALAEAATDRRLVLVVLRGVFLEGDSYGLLVDQYWPMALIALASLSAAGWLFRHRMY